MIFRNQSLALLMLLLITDHGSTCLLADVDGFEDRKVILKDDKTWYLQLSCIMRNG
jgi:hypothetical protein